MNWVITFFVYVMSVCCGVNLIKVEKTFYLVNNFWPNGQEHLRTDKGYLNKVEIGLDPKNDFCDKFHFSSKKCHHLKFTDLKYAILRDSMVSEASAFLESPEVAKFLWRFRFSFTDELIEIPSPFERYFFNFQEYVSYKSPEKMPDNSIKLSCGVSTDIRRRHIRNKIKGFVRMKLLRFNEYTKKVDKRKRKELGNEQSKLENGANFELYYFRNYSECMENLKFFFSNLCCFKLLKDDVAGSSTADYFDIYIDMTTTMKVSQFKERLYDKVYKNLRTLHGNEIGEAWKLIFDQLYDVIKEEMLKNKIFFPIGVTYDINYYIDQLSNLIFKLVEQEQMGNSSDILENEGVFIYGIDYLLKNGFKKLQLTVVKDLCESDYINNHFSNLLEINFKTANYYIIVEKIVCDYYNMFIYVVNLYRMLIKDNKDFCTPYPYFPPIFIDDYDLKIIDGIQIEFNWFTKFKIRGFDNLGEEVVMIKDIDYFTNEFGMLNCPSDVLKMKNIHEILVVVSEDLSNYKRFKVNEYISL